MKKMLVTKTKGFGLLEVLLAGVIIITMLGALVVLGKTVLNNLSLTKQRAQATFLAQQGIEMLRQIRDTNYIDNDPSTKWNSFVLENIADNKPKLNTEYVFDFKAASSTPAPNYPNRSKLVEKDGSGITGEVPLDGNKFTRTIIFKAAEDIDNVTDGLGNNITVDNNNAIIATCTITWGDNNSKSVLIDELITNSHPNF
ncbi:MAG: hypothetical protein WC080_04045 [Patescibacteria group bacterium]|jgi:Tfp pilus assembly protein PilV